MSGFKLTNLMDVEDSAVKFGYAPAIESRFARGDLESERVGVSYQRLAPDTRMPFGHHHRTQEEIYVFLSGSGRAKLDDEVVDVKAMDALRISSEVTRSFESGPEGLELLAFGGGDNGLQDAEVEPGWWAEDE
jgi:mannose-6-phosphate isomerase-like protein (cupin superfamily)